MEVRLHAPFHYARTRGSLWKNTGEGWESALRYHVPRALVRRSLCSLILRTKMPLRLRDRTDALRPQWPRVASSDGHQYLPGKWKEITWGGAYASRDMIAYVALLREFRTPFADSSPGTIGVSLTSETKRPLQKSTSRATLRRLTSSRRRRIG